MNKRILNTMYKVENIKWDTSGINREEVNKLPVISWISECQVDQDNLEEDLAAAISYMTGVPVIDFDIVGK